MIGGLLCATVATLIFVPAVFAMLHRGHASGDAQFAAEREQRTASRVATRAA